MGQGETGWREERDWGEGALSAGGPGAAVAARRQADAPLPWGSGAQGPRTGRAPGRTWGLSAAEDVWAGSAGLRNDGEEPGLVGGMC